MDGKTRTDLRRDPGRAQVAAHSSIVEDESFWQAYVAPTLDAAEVSTYLGLGSVGAVATLTEQHRLLAVPMSSGPRYPAFQFRAGEADPAIGRVVGILGEVVATPYTIASWLKGAKPDLLGGKTPLEWLESGGDPERVVAAAELAAAGLDR